MANVKQFHRIKVISFDLDGTLVDYRFVDSVWFEGIPRLYSVEKRVSFDDAKKFVKKEYDKVGKERLEWYDLHYWIKKFGLNATPQELLRYFEHRIKTYPEVPKVLDELKQRDCRLIIVTNARREFVESEFRKTGIENYFDRVFSSTADFGLVKKTVNLYQRVCNILEISPQEMIHVGDDQNFDFHVPRRLGILAFHLDRTGKHKGELVIQSLEELNRKLQML
jgi:putative hydrolase of the HAD superfamily